MRGLSNAKSTTGPQSKPYIYRSGDRFQKRPPALLAETRPRFWRGVFFEKQFSAAFGGQIHCGAYAASRPHPDTRSQMSDPPKRRAASFLIVGISFETYPLISQDTRFQFRGRSSNCYPFILDCFYPARDSIPADKIPYISVSCDLLIFYRELQNALRQIAGLCSPGSILILPVW